MEFPKGSPLFLKIKLYYLSLQNGTPFGKNKYILKNLLMRQSVTTKNILKLYTEQ